MPGMSAPTLLALEVIDNILWAFLVSRSQR